MSTLRCNCVNPTIASLFPQLAARYSILLLLDAAGSAVKIYYGIVTNSTHQHPLAIQR
ncbi:MAG: hypothetical protein FWE67_09455 [Planctomycetaceae bacterium]|nr:hypothetical protein [Planctomycetaceae bacterium]